MTVGIEVDDRLADGHARDRIRDDLGSTLFVQAAAGSGKTSALVSRVTALVDRGLAELREIAAISFTEAAAAELRGRVAVALADPGPDRVVTRSRRAAALLQLDEAAMTTIHGFAQRLLAEHPLEAGLPLRFEVADEIAASVAREDRFERFIDQLFDDPGSADLLRAATVLGIGVESLRALAGQMTERFDDVDLPPLPKMTVPDLVEEHFDRVRVSARRCLAHRGSCTDDEDRLFRRLVRLSDALEAADEAKEWLDALAWIWSLPPERKARVGQKGSWSGDGIEAVREALVEYEAERTAALDAIFDAVLVGIGRRMLTEAAAFSAERRNGGNLFFHDLLLVARDLLRDHPEVRDELRERYRHILVDEFQDTDPLQFEILSLLGTPPGGTALEPGRLFFVGDPMQSIYRFRGADVARYRSVRELVGPEGTVNLTTNFRSVPAICEFVSSTFAPLVDGPDSASIHLQARRDELDGPRVWSIGGGSEALRASERRTAEATEVVGAVAGLVARRAPVVVDGEPRPVRYGDVAVLVPVRTGLGELLGAFANAGIDVQLAESSLIYRTEEVAAVIAALRVVDDRGDDAEVIAALRSALFAVSDRALRAHAEAGGVWDLGVVADRSGPGDPSVLSALASLRALRDARRTLGPVGVLLELLDRRGVREIAAVRGGADAIRRIEFLVERARVCRDRGGRTLSDLLHFFELERRVGVRLVSHVTAEGRPDAVRILTVHGAKGLEFPVVILAELGGTIGSRPRPPSLLVDRRRVEIDLGGGRSTVGFDELAAGEAVAAREEAIRLAYVATTRARDYLIVSLHHRRTAEEPSSLAALFESIVKLPPAPTTDEFAHETPARAVGRSVIDRASIDQAVERHSATNASAARPVSVTPSALETPLAARPDTRRVTADDGDGGDGTDWRRARASSRIGRAVHAVLQRTDLVAPTNLAELARQHSEAEGCAEFVGDVESLALAATRAPIVVAAAASASLHRELPVTLATEDGYVEGVVDLCFEDEGGMVIVDYKTDVVADASEARARAERYRLQAGAYAWAIGSITGAKVERVVFLFLAPPDGSIEIDVVDIAGAIAEVQEVVEATLARDGTDLDHDRGR